MWRGGGGPATFVSALATPPLPPVSAVHPALPSSPSPPPSAPSALTSPPAPPARAALAPPAHTQRSALITSPFFNFVSANSPQTTEEVRGGEQEGGGRICSIACDSNNLLPLTPSLLTKRAASSCCIWSCKVAMSFSFATRLCSICTKASLPSSFELTPLPRRNRSTALVSSARMCSSPLTRSCIPLHCTHVGVRATNSRWTRSYSLCQRCGCWFCKPESLHLHIIIL